MNRLTTLQHVKEVLLRRVGRRFVSWSGRRSSKGTFSARFRTVGTSRRDFSFIVCASRRRTATISHSIQRWFYTQHKNERKIKILCHWTVSKGEEALFNFSVKVFVLLPACGFNLINLNATKRCIYVVWSRYDIYVGTFSFFSRRKLFLEETVIHPWNWMWNWWRLFIHLF